MYLLLTYKDNELIDAPEYFNSYEDAMSEANKLAKGCEDNTTFEVFKLVDRHMGKLKLNLNGMNTAINIKTIGLLLEDKKYVFNFSYRS